MQVVQQKLEQNKDVQVENILSVLPLEHSNFIRRYLRLALYGRTEQMAKVERLVLLSFWRRVICMEESF
ncbi:unnamed protein product [Prunus brigantina]